MNKIFHKDFVLMAIGQIISIFGNQMLRYVLPLYLLNQTGSSALFGTVSAISLIPMILLFPIGGIIADRVNKRDIMVILDFGVAALISAFCLLSGKVGAVPLMAVTMLILYGIQGAYQPAVKASVPVLVKPENIMKANSVVDTINSAASMAGPVTGGLLFSFLGLVPILYLSILCFFVSAVMEMFIYIPFEKRETSGNIAADALGDLKESFGFMFKKQPVLWKISLIFGLSNILLTSLILIALPVLITRRLGFAPDTANRLYGYAQGVVAAGAVLGGLLAGALSGKLKAKSSPALLTGCSLFILAGGIALQTLKEPMAIYLVLSIGSGLLLASHTLFQIQMMTYVQLLTPKDLTGKVISCFICAAMCTTPLGQFIYGIIFEKIGDVPYIPFYAAPLIMIMITVFTRRIFYSLDQFDQIKV
jgi:MFS family permease